MFQISNFQVPTMPDLNTIFDIVAHRLPAAGVEALLIGGFAVNYHGYTRNTLDVDFMIVAGQADLVRRAMTDAGFTNVVFEDNVTLYRAPDCPLRADFLNVDAETHQKLLSNAVTADVHGHRLSVPALRDLLAMKIFALSSQPARRRAKDLPDIAWLCVLHDLDVEADIRPLCERYGTPEVFAMIARQIADLRSP
jgi:hypothetical protein